MSSSVITAAYGRQASEALAAEIARCKGGSALAPVTVIVPSNFAGLSARRLLGAGVVGPGGIANVSFLTPFRLAELLTADQLLDTRPLTNPVLGAAVRRALAADPGPFAPVAQHEATETALAQLYAELSNLTPEALERLRTEGGRSAADAVAIYRRIDEYLHDFHGEAVVARAAASRPDLATALASFGPVIWYLPAPMTTPMANLIGTVLAAAAESSVIVGTTGHVEADAAVWATCEAAGVTRDDGEATATVPVVTAERIVSVTDADEEVRSVLRHLVQLTETGVPLDRIGIFFPTPNPYITIIEQQLAAAGIPGNGPSPRRLVDSVAGRTLLGALDLPAQRWRHDQVMKVVSGAPMRLASGPAHPAAWEKLTRQAGIVADLSDWTAKLTRLRSSLTERRNSLDPETDERWIQRIDGDIADIDQLEEFLAELAAGVTAVETADTWEAKTEAANELLTQLLGAGHTHNTWPDHERIAFERIEDVLARLATLGDLEPEPTHAVFLRALQAELDVARGRTGRFGEGVTYGPLGSAAGHDLDAVFVLGCVEGLCPSPRREDAMLSDAARLTTGGELAPRSARLHDQHRALLAALAAAPANSRTLMVPRGDLRGGRQPQPSRWVLDSVGATAGRRIKSSDFAGLPTSVVEQVPSFATGLLRASPSASVDERDLAVLYEFTLDGGDVMAHPTATLAADGLLLQRARRSSELTAWDGNLAGQPIPSNADRPLSPSRLEKWAGCGFRYYLGSVLGLGERDDPDQLIEISAMDKGNAIHRTLDLFIDEAIRDGVPAPDEPWTPAQRARLRVIAGEVLDAVEAEGRTGRRLLWRMNREDLLIRLGNFLDHDDAYRLATRSHPVATELAFGLDGEEPVTVSLEDGRRIAFRGRVDRIDQRDDDTLAVSDYKTGKNKFKAIVEGDPMQAGSTLQLGIYAEAAIQRFGDHPVEAQYWMINGTDERPGYAWDDSRRRRFLDVVTAIADGIEGGTFPLIPGDWDSFRNTHENCTYCDFDSVCPRDRGVQAEAKVDAPELRSRDALQWEPDPEPEVAS